MGIETKVFDPDPYFKTSATQAHLIQDAIASGHAGYIADALGIVARNRGISEIASQTGLSRQSLYTTLSESGNPTLDTLLKILSALELELAIRPKVAA